MLSRRVFLGAAALAAAGCGLRSDRTGTIRLGAGDPGGMYLAFGELLAERIHARYPGLDVQVRSTEGSVDNLARLRSGDIDLGLALADVAERDHGLGPAPSTPTAVARVYENYLQVIVRNSAAVQQLSDLRGMRVSIGAERSGGAVTSAVLFEAAGLRGYTDVRTFRLNEALGHLADGGIDALVWSGGVPTPAIADLDSRLPLRILDIGSLAMPMSTLSGYPYMVRRVPGGRYVPPGIRSIGVPNLLMCRPDLDAGLVAAVVEVLAADARRLVPPYVSGLQYLATPSMIQTGQIPLHPGAVSAYRRLHG